MNDTPDDLVDGLRPSLPMDANFCGSPDDDDLDDTDLCDVDLVHEDIGGEG